MSSKRKALVIALLTEMKKAGSWCGETHIQKTMYALDKLLKVETDFDFILYRHGPYSFDLHDELLSMAASGFLVIEQRYPYGPSLQPTPSGNELLARFPKMNKRLEGKIQFIAQKMSNKDVASLEKYATAIYVTEHYNEKEDEKAAILSELKPHISLEEAREALYYIDKLVAQAQISGY